MSWLIGLIPIVTLLKKIKSASSIKIKKDYQKNVLWGILKSETLHNQLIQLIKGIIIAAYGSIHLFHPLIIVSGGFLLLIGSWILSIKTKDPHSPLFVLLGFSLVYSPVIAFILAGSYFSGSKIFQSVQLGSSSAAVITFFLYLFTELPEVSVIMLCIAVILVSIDLKQIIKPC
jgi:hypothetical protein